MIEYIPPLAYFVAFIFVGSYLFLGNQILRALLNVSISVGLLFNIIEFVLRFKSTGSIQTSTPHDFLIMLSIAFAITYFVIYAQYQRPMIAMFLLPFPLICSVMATFAPVHAADVSVATSIWRYIHLPFIILGSTFFIASFFASVMYFLQERQLRTKSFGFVFKRFPPLNTINKILDMTLRLGFYFFTVGAISGFMWVLSVEYNFSSVVKIALALIAWVIFAFIVLYKFRNRITPRQTAFFTIMGFLAMLVSYVSVFVFLIG